MNELCLNYEHINDESEWVYICASHNFESIGEGLFNKWDPYDVYSHSTIIT